MDPYNSGYPPNQGYAPPPNQNYPSANDLNLNQMNINSGHSHQQPYRQDSHSGGFSIGGHTIHRPHLHDIKDRVFHSHQGPIEVVCGPLLRYIDTDYHRRVWRGSCLIVSNEHRAAPLRIELKSEKNNNINQVFEVHAEKLDTYRQQYHFWRYELNLPLLSEPQKVIYTASSLGDNASFDFHIPAIQDSMRFMFYSCNGYSDIAPEIKEKFGGMNAPLWQDVLDRHEIMPFHVLIGGGDQLYQDKVIKEDFMKPWNDETNAIKRVAMTLTPDMINGFEKFYFYNYVENFG